MPMKFDLDNLNPGTWFDLEEGKEDGARICLRVCEGAALEEIRAKTTKKRVEFRKGQRFEVEEVDERLQTELFWDHCIVDWEGIEDADGTPIPCTRENKAKLIQGSPVFLRLVSRCIDQLTDELEAQREAEEKN